MSEQQKTDDARVVDNPDRQRFELWVEETRVGRIDYRSETGRVVLTHTEVSDDYRGQGLAGRLTGAALDDVRERGLRVTPVCPYVAEYIRRHREYVDLVDDEHRPEFTASDAA